MASLELKEKVVRQDVRHAPDLKVRQQVRQKLRKEASKQVIEVSALGVHVVKMK
jgi:hypothetical protein